MELVLTFITVTAFPPPRTHADITGRWSSVFVWPPVWGQFHGHPTKWDVLFPWWSRAKATRSALQNFTSLTHRTAHHYIDVASKHLLRLLLSISSPPPPPPLFSPEPADRVDVLPAWWPHRLLGGLSEESQGVGRNGQSAMGHLCGPGEEVASPSQRGPVTQVPLQKWWAAKAHFTHDVA